MDSIFKKVKQKECFFVFGDEDDIFYLPSMLRLSFYDYLYFQLKARKIEHIFQVRAQLDIKEILVEVKIRTDESFKCNLYGKNKTAWDIKKEPGKYPHNIQIKDLKKAFLWISKQLSCPDSAIIIDIVSLDMFLSYIRKSFFRTSYEENFKDVLRLAKGILVVTFPLEVDEKIIDIMSCKKGSFFELFCLNECITEQDSKTSVYTRLDKENNVIELGDISNGEIGYIVDNYLFDCNQYTDIVKKQNIQDFLFYWLNCDEIRKKCMGGSYLFEKKYGDVSIRVSRKFIFEHLKQMGVTGIVSIMSRLYGIGENASYGDYLCKKYGTRTKVKEHENPVVKYQSTVLRMLESKTFFGDVEKKRGDEEAEFIRQLYEGDVIEKKEWETMRLAIREARCVMPNNDICELIGILCDDLDLAVNESDINTIYRIENTLMLCSRFIYDIESIKIEYRKYKSFICVYIEESRKCYYFLKLLLKQYSIKELKKLIASQNFIKNNPNADGFLEHAKYAKEYDKYFSDYKKIIMDNNIDSIDNNKEVIDFINNSKVYDNERDEKIKYLKRK